MKFIENQYTNGTEILKFPDHYVALPVTVDDTDIVANEDGKKVIKAGTIVGGGVLADPTKKVSEKNDATYGKDAEGVLLNDVNVTYGPTPGTMVIHGFIDLNKLPTEPDATVSIPGVTFLK